MKKFRVLFGAFVGSFMLVSSVCALEFQTDSSSGFNPVTLRFRFGETLTIDTSSGSIAIAGLTPGSSDISASNYTVTVNSNSLGGYTLSATVGCASGQDCYDSKNLSDGNGNNFTMLSSTGALTAGTWGVSLDSSATKNSNFSPLAKYDETATTINQTTDAIGTAATGYAGTNSTTVRIGAYATANQVVGTYTNVINFIAVVNAVPNCGNYIANLCMQNASNWAGSLSTGQEVQATDARDGKVYYVAKLADGNVWMTQNLDHNIVTTANFYTPQNTDIKANWTPSTATYTTGTTTWDKTSTGYSVPQSYDPGDLCWNGTLDSNYETTISTGTVACGNDKHMHIGNYYSWTAAIAMNDSSSYTAYNTDVDQSICPAGWMLPKSGTTQTGSVSFIYLWDQYSSTFDKTTMMNSPLYYVYGGDWHGASENVGSYGFYWSSVVGDSGYAYDLYFDVGGDVYPQNFGSREFGGSVRCVLR